MVFINVTGYGDGVLVYYYLNNGKPFIFNNNTIINSTAETSLLYFDNCKNIWARGNSFYNIQGNIIISKNTSFRVENSNFSLSYCSHDFGAIFNLQKNSKLISKNIFIENVTNEKDGGFFYIEESEISIENFIVSDTKSFNYAGCILGANSIVNFSKINISEFLHGCIYLTYSFVEIHDSYFNFNMGDQLISSSKSNNEYCWSTLCLFDAVSLNITNSVFKRNKKQTYYGGVSFIAKKKYFFLKRLYMSEIMKKIMMLFFLLKIVLLWKIKL